MGKIEFLNNRRLQYQYLSVMIFIVLIMFGYLYYQNVQLNNSSNKIYTIVRKREVDGKGFVSITAYFSVNNKQYRALHLITSYEKEKGVIVDEGDSVAVKYSIENPSNNKILFLTPSHYKKISN